MKYCLYILIFLTVSTTTWAQDRGGSLRDVPDSLLFADSVTLENKRITAYRLTRSLGDSYIAPMDTDRFNYGNSTLVEGRSIAVGYLANVGSPARTKIFSERKEARDYIYADAYDYYITTPENAYYYDTKLPYTHVTFAQAGSSLNREDRLKGFLTWNFGKKINVGAEMDYIYGRGQYWANGNKLLSYRLFGSYRSDRYELNAYLNNYNFVNYENGGLENDRYITHIEEFTVGRQSPPRKEYPVRYYDTWNRIRGKQYYFSHRYNLGFMRQVGEADEEGNYREIFIPVTGIIHTFEYEDNSRRFISNMPSESIDSRYLVPANEEEGYNPNFRRLKYVYGIDESLNDVSSAWNLKNTVGLSMREGFQDWAKFGLTAFATFEKRRFKLPARIPGLTYDEVNGSGENPQPATLDYPHSEIHDEFSMYLGADLSKKRGAVLTYNARGELCMFGNDLGEFRASGDLQTTFSLFGKEAFIKANGYLRNVTPAFFQRYHHSRYFWWDSQTGTLDNTQQFYAGGEVYLGSTQTTLSAGVESIQNYIYFNLKGLPEQYRSNLQVISARLKQDIRSGAFGWENEAVFQLSSKEDVLPLPQISAYSNIYVHFKLAKVLTLQVGADVHYHTEYYAPYYEPATQQFQIQNEKKIGNYPLINGYVNFHLKQARFFVELYNLGSTFVTPNYFSLLHYPLNPMTLKLGIAVVFNN
ncbi:MAG: putative porin [Tannerellaceae bacterium]|nr:putative porin [Tannerellaceae bacterium]